jgi:TonB family protein
MNAVRVSAASIQYPPDETHLVKSLFIVLGLHFLVAALVCLILYLLGIVSLKDLLQKGGAIAMSGPAPEQQLVVQLKQDDVQPPPAAEIEFIRQILIPKVVQTPPPVPPPKPEPPKPPAKTPPKQVTKAPPPKYTAPNATGAGNSSSLSAFALGTSGLPAPPYPYQARLNHQEGTVRLHIVFDGGGGIASADVVSSSGVEILDSSSRIWVFGHWKNASLAGKSVNVPLIYDMAHASAH